jgi:hypothetical protein
LVDRNFRGSVRSPGDSSQLSFNFQNYIHRISEGNDYDTFDRFDRFTINIDKNVGYMDGRKIYQKDKLKNSYE